MTVPFQLLLSMNKSNWIKYKFAKTSGYKPPIQSISSNRGGLINFKVSKTVVHEEKSNPTLIERPIQDPLNQIPPEANKVIKSAVLDSGLGKSHLEPKNSNQELNNQEVSFSSELSDSDGLESEDCIERGTKIVVKSIDIGGGGGEPLTSDHLLEDGEPAAKKAKKEATPRKYNSYKLRIV